MPDNTYTAKTRLLAPVPRSKRMRDANVTVAQQSSSSQQVEQTWNRDTESVQDAEVLVPVAQPLIDILRLRNGNHIVNITVDNNGNLHVDAGLYSDSFISALGLNPDAPTPGGGGLDETALWQILEGSNPDNHIINSSFLPEYNWSDIAGKPSWIGSSKPSYAFNEISGTVTNAQLAGSIANAKLTNSSITIAGTSVSLGESITTSTLQTALGVGTFNSVQHSGYPNNQNQLITRSFVSYWNGAYNANGSSNLNYCKYGTIIGTSNYSSYALPLTGGTLTGTLNVNQSAWDNGIVLNRTAANAGACIKCLSNNTVLGTFGINGSKQFEIDFHNGSSLVQYANVSTSTVNFGRSDVSNYAINISSSTSRLRLLANSNGHTYIQSGNPAWTATADLHINGYNSNNISNLYLEANNVRLPSASYLFMNTNTAGIYLNGAGVAWHNASNSWVAACLSFDANGYTMPQHHVMLDGANASSSTANTTQLVFRASSTQQVALSSIANALVINPTTSSATGQIILGVNGQLTSFRGSGNFGIGVDSPAYKLHVSGNIYATGAITAGASSSDRRLKKDIKNFNALEIIGKLKPVSFKWNNNAKKLDDYFKNENTQYGLIAQEAKDVIPDLTFEFKDNKYMGVHYEKLTPILLQAVKEQQAEIDNLKKELSELKNIVKQLINK